MLRRCRTPAKLVAVIEAGIGFGFMAMIIGYLPVLYQAFSRREQNIALLDARAGSPPAAGELWRRCGDAEHGGECARFLADWEVWAADLLESHLSFPVLSFYRSQHDNQSWLAALATVLDASALHLLSDDKSQRRRAELTFAMARHACVDLCLVFWLPPAAPSRERITSQELETLFTGDRSEGQLAKRNDLASRLVELRLLYEPFLQSLANYFCFYLPRFFPDKAAPDNWQTTAWTKRAPGITELPLGMPNAGDHFG